MNTIDFEKIILSHESAKNFEGFIEQEGRKAAREIEKYTSILQSDIDKNLYTINKGKLKIVNNTIVFNKKEEKSIPSIIIFEGDILEKRLENPFFLVPFTELIMTLDSSNNQAHKNTEQYWLKTSIFKKRSIEFSGASLLLSSYMKKFTQDINEHTPFESMWYCSLDQALMGLQGFPGYEAPCNKANAKERMATLSESYKVGTLTEINRYKKFRKYQQTPIERSVSKIEFLEKDPNLFK